MAWNCRGLDNSLVVRGLLRCQKSIQVDILFLSETRMEERNMVRIRFSLGLSNMVVVIGDGKEGNYCVMEEGGNCDFEELLDKSH